MSAEEQVNEARLRRRPSDSADSEDEKRVTVTDILAEFAEVTATWPLHREFRYEAHRFERTSEFPGQAARYALIPETVRTPLRMAGAMGLTKYFLPSLSVRGIGAVEGLMISSLSFLQIAFLVIRHPLLFDQNLLTAFFQLSRLFLASPIASAILGGLVIGHLVTGVVLPGQESPERWKILRTLKATGIAVVGGLVSIVLFIPGLWLPIPWGYGLVPAGFFLGPWLHAQFNLRADRLAAPSHEVSSRWPTRREALRSLLSVPPFLAVWTVNAASVISVQDTRLFLQAAKAAAQKPVFPESSPHDKSIEVAHLSSGLIRFRRLNPQGRWLVLGLHGVPESLETFPPALEPIMRELDMQGIFIDRPGIGPVSTPWPGHDLADWAQLVEEFDKKVLDSKPISIIGHSGGGILSLACAKLSCVRVLALVCSPGPWTIGSYLKTFLHYDDMFVLDAEFLPHKLLPVVQDMAQQILYDWPTYFREYLKSLGSIDQAFLIQNEKAFHDNTVTGAMQGAAALLEDYRLFSSPWMLSPADAERVPILIFSGAGDLFVTPSNVQDLQAGFARNALRYPPFADMGHYQTLEHYKRIFAELGKQLDVAGKKTLPRAA